MAKAEKEKIECPNILKLTDSEATTLASLINHHMLSKNGDKDSKNLISIMNALLNIGIKTNPLDLNGRFAFGKNLLLDKWKSE